MSAITAVLYRESKIRSTNLTFIFWDLLYPLVNLLVFGVGINAALGTTFGAAGLNYNAFFLAGCLGMGNFAIASNTSWSFFMDRDNGIFYEMLTYPMSRAEYLSGKMLFNAFVALVQALLTIVCAVLFLHVPFRWDLLPLLVAGLAGGSAAWFYFYAIFALRIRRNDIFNSVTSILYFILLFVSSMFYPVEPLPKWFRTAALANPMTWHVDLLRYATIGLGDPRRIALETAALGLFGLASYFLAIRALDQQ
jgi:ABC-type multidrug transport system permease subunit